MLTRIFKNGNSLAVRIPKKLTFDNDIKEVEIERRGDTLLIRALERESWAGIGAIFHMFSSDFMEGGREFHGQEERHWETK